MGRWCAWLWPERAATGRITGSRSALSLGRAVEVAGVSRQDFEAALRDLGLARSCSAADLEEDLRWVAGT